MASSLAISSVKIDGTIYFAGQDFNGRKIIRIEPTSISTDREILHEFVLMSEKHIIAVLRDYVNADHHIEYKLGSSRIVAFDFNGTPYHLGHYINGMPITDIGHVVEQDVPDTRVYFRDAALETIAAMSDSNDMELWYKPYSVF